MARAASQVGARFLLQEWMEHLLDPRATLSTDKLTAIIAIQLLFTYIPFMNELFHSAPISVESWLRIAFVAIVAFVAVELEKWIRFGWHRK